MIITQRNIIRKRQSTLLELLLSRFKPITDLSSVSGLVRSNVTIISDVAIMGSFTQNYQKDCQSPLSLNPEKGRPLTHTIQIFLDNL